MGIELHTSRLILRKLSASDAAAVAAYRSLPEVARYQGWNLVTAEDALALARSQETLAPDTPGTWYQLVITLCPEGTVIGDLGLHFLAEPPATVEVGITLAPEFQGLGYAHEAMQAAMNYVFKTLRKHRLVASVDPRNTKSVALLERLGLRREAEFRLSLWFKGEWVDDWVYAILASEW